MTQPANREAVSRADAWGGLRRYTSARIALGRAGSSLPTRELLAFQADHARAIDAVYAEFDRESAGTALKREGIWSMALETRAESRAIYLQRPDYGRRLDEASRGRLADAMRDKPRPDALIAIVDGLSAEAVHRHAVAVATRLVRRLQDGGLTVAPIPLVRYGRVALQDELGEVAGAKVVVSLIGERPGLGTPDSLGAYLVYGPRMGNTDANRNCVSNIRPQGLAYDAAVETISWLVTESLRRKVSGVELKDDRRLVVPKAAREIENG
jgi:ethanolamine ammonia-lyase small subunit